jgi:hypothetical protein
MASLKGATKSALEDRSPRFLLGTIALGVVVSLIVGFGIGYAAHTTSTKHKAKNTAAAKKAAKAKKAGKGKKGTAKGGKKTIVPAPDLTGGIFAVKPSSIVVLNDKSKGVKIVIGHKTRIALAKTGNSANIVVGAKVIVTPSKTDPTKASQVVVLPSKALIGTAVSAVDPGNSLTIKTLAGTKTITTKGATVFVTSTGTKKNLIRREVVTVRYWLIGKKRTATATQVVVMPAAAKVG